MEISRKNMQYRYLCVAFVFLLVVPLQAGYTGKPGSGDVSSILPVTTAIFANCQFTGSNVTLAFGNYDPAFSNATQDKDATTQFSLRCIKGTSAKVVINDGLNSLGGIRRMKGPGNSYMNYQLYTNASRSAIWDANNAISFTARNPNPRQFNIYGRIPAGQDVGSGSYVDTVVMSITF